MKTFLRNTVGIVAMAGSVFASAGVIDPLIIQNGNTVIEDDSGEVVYRPIYDNDEIIGYQPATGAIQQGDILLGILDYPQVSGVKLDVAGIELTSVFLIEVDSVTPAGEVCLNVTGTGLCSAGDGFRYDSVDLEFSSVDAQVWDDLLNIDLAALGGSLGTNLDGTIQMFWDDAANNLVIENSPILGPGDDYPTALMHAMDGELRFILGDTGATDAISAAGAPLLINTFGDSRLEAGVTPLGTFNYTATFLWDNLAGIQTTFSASGANLANNTNCCGVQDDTQGTFYSRTPTPGTLFLIGSGILGLGLSRRRKN